MIDTTETKATTIVMISVLARQLENWVIHAREVGLAKQAFKHELGKTATVLRSLLNHLKRESINDDQEDFFELTAQYSDMVEQIISINDQNDLNDIMALIEAKKIKEVVS